MGGCLICGCQSKTNTEPNKQVGLRERCYGWLEHLCSESLMGRKTGSVYDEMTFNYLCEAISAIGFSYDVQVFKSSGGNSILRNIIIKVEGAGDRSIVIGAHYDGALLSSKNVHYPAANDNASGVVTVLALLDTLKRSAIKPNLNMIIALWDGEEVFDGSWAQGSRYFVQNCGKNKGSILYYLNLDSVGHNHVLYIKHKGPGFINDVVNALISNGRLLYVPIDMNNNNGGSSDYVSFGQVGIPYISFGDHNDDMCSFNSHSINDVVEAISIDRIIIHVANLLDLIQLSCGTR